jgi:hypothetical protein
MWHVWVRRGGCVGFGGETEGKRSLGRPRRRWVDNIRMDLQDMGIWTGLGWPRIETVGGRLGVRYMNLGVP